MLAGLMLVGFRLSGGTILPLIPRSSTWLVVLSTVLIGRLFLALLVIPPWQGPDEQAHVAVAEVWRNRLSDAATEDPGREEEILRSMAVYSWWEHYGRTPPATLSTRFALLTFTDYEVAYTIGVDPTSPGYPRLYYAVVGTLLALIGSASVVTDLYVMRIVSAFLALLTLGVAWFGARRAFGEPLALLVTSLLALHPQFAVTASTAGPDALVNLAGASLWLAAVVAVTSPEPRLPLAALWLAALAGAAADRMGAPLIAAAALASGVVVLRSPSRQGFVTAATIVVGASAIVGAPHLAGDPTLVADFQLAVAERARTWDFLAEFTALLFQTWWIVFGWLRYRAPDWWFLVPIVLSCASAVGLIRQIAVRPRTQQHVLLGLAAAMIVVQLAAVYWTFFRLGVAGQGRYLFPFLVPTLILFAVGLQGLVPARYHNYAAAGLIAAFAVLDALAWLIVGVPAFVS